ncbi:MAG: flagellar biosynthesis regulator FlaF [Rhizobiales bacterium]|nr:flagellar biosynthesis regulator FlaF [Hyphomicrobiales bacterium]MBI3672775.1 flagellar biosynthesis regulator FlaF [Hyphomicrobiales bacterium]
MYESIYAEMAAETTATIRDNERQAFEHSIRLLEAAKEEGRGSTQSVTALLFLSRLWGVLLEDLARPDNGLPETLRASLISIGIWMLRRAEDIRQGRVDDFQALIDVSQSICQGLKRH